MTAQVNNDNPTKDEPKLLRRDFILLPALALFTIVVLIAASEMFARKNFVDAETHLAPCLVLNDISTGVRGVPNSRCFAKGSESAWAEYKFNSFIPTGPQAKALKHGQFKPTTTSACKIGRAHV